MTTTTPTSIEPGTTVHVPPGTLLLERNIRDANPDPALVDSIRAVGVLEPITAVLTTDGDLSVRYGFRRTLAAVAAGLDTVPVYVTGTDELSDASEVDRIIRQRDENTHRTGLTDAEDAQAVAQLAAFGLSADQIAEQARIAKDRVHTALKVTGSKLAKGAIDRYTDLTLDQAAAVAEFEHDPETFKELVVTALQRPGQFAHTIQRKRDDRDRPILFAAARDELEAAGVRVLEKGLGYTNQVDSLKDKKTGTALTIESHATCPGRAATLYLTEVYVDTAGNTLHEAEVENRHEAAYADELARLRKVAEDDGHDPDEVVDDDEVWESVDPRPGLTRSRRAIVDTWYCLYPETHGHVYRWGSQSTTPAKKAAADMSDEERDKARAARQLVIDNNKAWDSAEVVRRGWLKALAKVKTPPKGTAVFLATALSTDRAVLADYRTHSVTSDILGNNGTLTTHIDKLLKGATENRAQVLALAQVLCGYEASLTRDSWRGNGKTNAAGRYLRFLETAGYDLSDVEKYAISTKTA